MIIHDLVSAFGYSPNWSAPEKLKQMFRFRASRAVLVTLVLIGGG